jgi:hypothetical protein
VPFPLFQPPPCFSPVWQADAHNGSGHHRPRSGGVRALPRHGSRNWRPPPPPPRLLLGRVFHNFGEPRMLRTRSYNRAGNGVTCSLRHIDPDVPPAVVLRSPHRLRRYPSGLNSECFRSFPFYCFLLRPGLARSLHMFELVS